MDRDSMHRTGLAVCLVLLALLFVQIESMPAEDPALAEWSEFSRGPGSGKLLHYLRCIAGDRLAGNRSCEQPDITTPRFFGSLGMFVTLKKGNRVRGCYGAFSHGTADACGILSDYLTGALTRDPRYDPLDVSELADTRIIITITSQPFPVDDINAIDINHFGVVLQCGTDTAIFVPAEIKNISYIEKKVKGSACQVSAFKAVTLQ